MIFYLSHDQNGYNCVHRTKMIMKDKIIIISLEIPEVSIAMKDDYFLKKKLSAIDSNKPDSIFQSIGECSFQKGV